MVNASVVCSQAVGNRSEMRRGGQLAVVDKEQPLDSGDQYVMVLGRGEVNVAGAG